MKRQRAWRAWSWREWTSCGLKRTVPALSWQSGHWWYWEDRGVHVGAVFTAMEMLEEKTDHTVGFPDAENVGGEVLEVVPQL